MSSETRALVIGHGDFASGIVSAVEQITGQGSLLLALSNNGLGAEGIEVVVRRALDEHGVRVIFTDLPGGSATMAVRRVQRSMPGITVVTGANLAALLDFVQHPEATEDIALEALERGKASMMAFRSSNAG